MKKTIGLLLVATFYSQAVGKDFTYGLWGNGSSVAQKQTVKDSKPKGVKKKKTQKGTVNFSWKDFLPKDLPAPFVKLMENPTEENVRKYWKAYEEFADRITRTERLIKLMQVKYAERISKKYSLLYFFSPDCPACREYTPELFVGLLKEGFTLPVKAYVVGDLRKGAVMMSALGVTTTRIATSRMLSEFNVQSLPTAVLLDLSGRVVAEFSGGEVLNLLNFLKEKRDEEMASDSNSTAVR